MRKESFEKAVLALKEAGHPFGIDEELKSREAVQAVAGIQ